MNCQILFSWNNKKNTSKCCLLNFLPSMLSDVMPEILKLFQIMQWLNPERMTLWTDDFRTLVVGTPDNSSLSTLIYIYMYIFIEKVWQTIHMKCQHIFFEKKKEKYSKCHLLQL